MKNILSCYVMAASLALVALIQLIISLFTMFQTLLFISIMPIIINLFWFVPRLIIKLVYKKFVMNFLFEVPSPVHVKRKGYKCSTFCIGRNKRAFKRRRSPFSPVLSSNRKLSHSFETKPIVKVPTASHEQQSFYDCEPTAPKDLDLSQKYYSLFSTGFDLGVVPSKTKPTRSDEAELIHERSVLKFLKQIDNDDAAFFSKHLDKNYKQK